MTQKKIILALDLGLHTGWAIYNNGKIKSGTFELKATRFESNGMCFVKLNRELERLKIDEFLHIDKVFFESVDFTPNTYAAHMYGGFSAIVMLFCENFKIEFEGVSVKTIKKFITETGKAEKKDVIKAVQNLGFNPNDDNEADALALLLYGLKLERIDTSKKI